MRQKKFLRRNTTQYLRLGSKRKKLRKWRKPKGRDNKMRLKMKGYPKNVEIGFKKHLHERGRVSGKKPVLISNISDLDKVEQGNIAFMGKMGKKKKIQIAKISIDRKIAFFNFNPQRYLKINEKSPLEINNKNISEKSENKQKQEEKK
ncbi:MAG: eL32 family ribosomal protein [Candidatus Pacearchaeota archaeon]